jgi:predicted amidohydrolase
MNTQVLAIVVALPGLLAGQTPVAAQPAPGRLKVAAVQFRSSFDIKDNQTRLLKSLEQLAEQGVQVAVFPECALTGYRKDLQPPATAEEIAAAEERIRQTCMNRRIAAVVGSIYRTDGRAYNAAVVFNSRGELVERFGKLMLAGEKWATPGNHIAFFELEGIPSTVIICHDERYPEFVRLPAMAGARVVYYISHESGLREEKKLRPYQAQMMARAVENSVFVVAANAPANRDTTGSHGQSRIISEDGNILEEGSFFGEDSLIKALDLKPRKLERPLTGLMADWWQQGLDTMLRNRRRSLE